MLSTFFFSPSPVKYINAQLNEQLKGTSYPNGLGASKSAMCKNNKEKLLVYKHVRVYTIQDVYKVYARTVEKHQGKKNKQKEVRKSN